MKFSELELEESVLEALDAMRFDECPLYRNKQFQLSSKAKI
jgi:hypothetical protein